MYSYGRYLHAKSILCIINNEYVQSTTSLAHYKFLITTLVKNNGEFILTGQSHGVWVGGGGWERAANVAAARIS